MMNSKELIEEANDLNNYLGGGYDSIILDVQKQLNRMAKQRKQEKLLRQKLLEALDLN